MSQSQTLPAGDSVDFANVDIELGEYDSTEPLDLSSSALRMLESEVNSGKTRIGVRFNQDGHTILQATQHVGIVALPSGPTIQIRPKGGQTNLLQLLRYSQGVDSVTVERETSILAGRTFIEALAALFDAELENVIRKGLRREYRRVDEEEGYLRGRLDVQNQIRRQGIAPTQFECSYDEFTYDTVTNQAILFAATALTQFVRDRTLQRSLQKHCHLLRQRITLTPVRPIELEKVEITHINAYYANLLRLTKLVLRSIFVREFKSGHHRSFSMLIDMNQIFEACVDRAVSEVVKAHDGLIARSQFTTQNLVSDGKHTISIRPDLVISTEEGDVVLVGDAKWKFGKPPNSDFYQIVSYQLAHDVPGALLYPEQREKVQSIYSVIDEYQLATIEVPTPRPTEQFDRYTHRLHHEMKNQLLPIFEGVQ